LKLYYVFAASAIVERVYNYSNGLILKLILLTFLVL